MLYDRHYIQKWGTVVGRSSPIEALACSQPSYGLTAAARHNHTVASSLPAEEFEEEDPEESKSLWWFSERALERETLIDDIKSSEGITDFKFGESYG